MSEHLIPPMTHPFGAVWRQPDRKHVLVDDTDAMITKGAFDALHEYSCTMPTGVYEGKMWKARTRDDWYLCWFGFSTTGDPKMCSINVRPLEIV